MGDYKSHGAPQEGGSPRLAGPGRMTREIEGSRVRCGRGNGLTGVSKEKAHSSLWTRSPALGTRIVGNTDSSASSLSSAMTPAAAPSHSVPPFLVPHPLLLRSNERYSLGACATGKMRENGGWTEHAY